ncbi:LOW QUALITY PROTEIN: taste receptor type 2 member 46-like [Rhynchonycteris naso]
MTLLLRIFSILVMTEFALGNIANGFIALVNCIDWLKTQKISFTDQILTALAASRIGLLWTTGLHWYGTLLNPTLYSSEVRTIAHIAWAVSSHFSVWLATSLCILYLLKIANFSRPFFLCLKRKAERVVLMILLGSSVFLVCYVVVIGIDKIMYNGEYEGNITRETNSTSIVRLSSMTVFMLTHFICFTVTMTALLLLIFSLWKHLRKMQLSSTGSQDPSTKVYVRAIQTVISFLLLFIFYILAQSILLWNSMKNNSVFMVCHFLSILYPSNHALILIWGNKKLRQAFLSFLWQLRCLKERK